MSENNDNFQETPIIDMGFDTETTVSFPDTNEASETATSSVDVHQTAPEVPSDNMILDMGNPATTPSIIKVIGVGGGGGNAVNYMYRTGIKEVNFAVCNTDSKALQDSPVPYKVQLGKDGLGAGNRPERARQAANESIDQIRALLDANTKMVFITAGMGGGTGTGAAPVIAHEAKERGILTVGIVTIPFQFEGNKKIDQALDGVDAIAKEVDALLVINNELLRTVYPDLTFRSAFEKADTTLSTAARSIAEIITMHGIINLDFQDVCTVLRQGGIALMSTGYGEGENRVREAIEDALNSPLLNNRDIKSSTKILLSISFNDLPDEDNEPQELMMEEINEVDKFMSEFRKDVETKWGVSIDRTLGKKVKVTILATGFDVNAIPGMEEHLAAKNSEEEQRNAQEENERAERRGQYYQTNNPKGVQPRFYKIYHFEPEDLENEELISLVEAIPTCRRTKEQLSEIRSKTQGMEIIES
jgi:cell division protein ftsZ